MALVVDTGPLFAALDRNDGHHRACAALLLGSVEEVLIPAPVIVELEWLTRRKLDAEAFRSVMREVRAGLLRVVDLKPEDYGRAGDLVAIYEDFPLGFVDAAVLAIVERLGETKLATLDHRHFRALRPRHVESLELLPA